MKNQAIAVLGAGSWGTALAMVLANNGQEVHLWDRDQSLLQSMAAERCNSRYLPDIPLPAGINICVDLPETLANVGDILIVVPSHAFSDALQSIKPYLNTQRIVWATKGLEPGSGNFLHQVLERELGNTTPYAVLSGPSFAKEVAQGLPTAVALASKDRVFAESLSAKFSNDVFKVFLTDDVIGVQLGGVVKNVLGVAVGLSDGVQFGANARAALMTRGLAEMMSLGEVLGARRETLMGLAGCGDVILTCTDNQSRNRRFGLLLAEGLTEKEALQRIGQVVEAVYNVEQLRSLGEFCKVKLPITEQVFRVMKQNVSSREAIKALFKQAPTDE